MSQMSKDIMLGISGFKDAGAWYAAIRILAIMDMEELEVDMPLVNCVQLPCIAVAANAMDRLQASLPSGMQGYQHARIVATS